MKISSLVRVEYGESANITLDIDNIYFTDPIIWSTDNNDVAELSEDTKNSVVATISGKSIGNTIIRLQVGDIQAESEAFVGYLVDSVDIGLNELNFYDKQSQKIEANILPENATNSKILWSSMNEDIATVDENGNVTPVSNGDTRIIAISEDGGYYDMCYVQVMMNIPVTGITLNYSDYMFTKGDYARIVATVFPTDATVKNVLWTSSNENVVTVHNGVITAISDGQAVVTAYTEDGEYKASCNVVVNRDGTDTTESDRTYEAVVKENQGISMFSTIEVASDVSIQRQAIEANISLPSETVKKAEICSLNSSKTSMDTKNIVYKGIKYKIETTKSGNKVATVIGTKLKKKKISIPNYIYYKDKKIKVTKIEKNAFKSNKKITKVVIGRNVNTIGQKAFYKCSKLKKIVIKSKKIKTIHSDAFYGISKNSVFDGFYIFKKRRSTHDINTVEICYYDC